MLQRPEVGVWRWWWRQRYALRGASMVLCLLLAACHTAPIPVAPVPAPTSAPTPLPQSGEPYIIDAERSDVRLFVKRDGPMAALGHNHVIAIRKLQGTVYAGDEPQRAHFELHFPVAELSIDEPAMRTAAGADYQSVVNDAARTGTRNNMLGARLLQSGMFPEISVTSGTVTVTAPDQVRLQLQMKILDHVSVLEVPVHWQRDADTLQAESSFTLQQTALGLTPFSVAMGAIRVADAIEVQARIVARRAPAGR